MTKRQRPDFTMEERRRELTTSERAAFGLKGPETWVRDAWLEVDIGDGWRAAFRLVPFAGQPVVAELRLMPADEYRGRAPGGWRADVLGVAAHGAARIRKTLRGRGSVDCPAVRQGITARLLRRVPLGAHKRYAAEFFDELRGSHPAMASDLGAWGFTPEHAEESDAQGPSQRGRGDLFYARLARDYVERLGAGSRRPVADLAERNKLDAEVIRDAVHAARERGLLTRGRQGTPGGQLTPRALRLLKARRDR